MLKINVKILIIMLLMVFISGCKTSEIQKAPLGQHSNRVQSNENTEEKQILPDIIPFKADQESFQFIVGWLSDEEILVSESAAGKSVLTSYNLFNGSKNKKIETNAPIITAKISPSRDYVLIHSSSSPYEAILTIYRLDTNELVYETTIESNEITFEWNPNDESKILVVAFYEDWSFKTFSLNMETDELINVDLPHPFGVWADEESILILNWDTDSPSITAPLVKVSENGKEEIFKGNNYYHVSSWKDVSLAISVDETDETKANYVFFNEKLESIYSFQNPHLTKYSNWHVPFYSLTNEGKSFWIIEPLESGSIDEYAGGFQLVKKGIQEKQSEVIIESISNTPISCSPNGELCLNGYQYENVILTRDREIQPFLILENEKDR